jgi:hypothetical protein
MFYCSSYFGAFSNRTLNRFWDSFSAWEVDTIVVALPALTTQSSSVRTAVTLHILSNPTISRDDRVLELFASTIPSLKVDTLPGSLPPVGLFYLRTNPKVALHSWAQEQLDKFANGKTQEGAFDERFRVLVQNLSFQIAQGQDNSQLSWNALYEVFKWAPAELLSSAENFGADVRHLLTTSLSAKGSRMLSCISFEIILKILFYLQNSNCH